MLLSSTNEIGFTSCLWNYAVLQAYSSRRSALPLLTIKGRCQGKWTSRIGRLLDALCLYQDFVVSGEQDFLGIHFFHMFYRKENKHMNVLAVHHGIFRAVICGYLLTSHDSLDCYSTIGTCTSMTFTNVAHV